MKYIFVLVFLLLAACATVPETPVITKPPPAHEVEVPRPPTKPRPPVARPAKPVPSVAAIPFKTVIAVQACMDRNNFSPGCIDGQMSDQMISALRAWQSSRGLPVTGKIDDATLQRVGDLDAELTAYTVAAEDHESLAELPLSWTEKAHAKWLGYETVLERLAEKYHASQDALRDLNPDAAWPNPPAGTVLNVPHSLPGRYVEVARIHISLSKRELDGIDADGKTVVHFPCTIALHADKRPTGELKIVNAANEPTYTFDPAVFADDEEAQTMTAKLLIPPGPNNPVGIAWLSLDRPGFGIHGTPKPEDIGQAASHGCFRLANWNAQKLIKMVKIGTPVTVSD